MSERRCSRKSFGKQQDVRHGFTFGNFFNGAKLVKQSRHGPHHVLANGLQQKMNRTLPLHLRTPDPRASRTSRDPGPRAAAANPDSAGAGNAPDARPPIFCCGATPSGQIWSCRMKSPRRGMAFKLKAEQVLRLSFMPIGRVNLGAYTWDRRNFGRALAREPRSSQSLAQEIGRRDASCPDAPRQSARQMSSRHPRTETCKGRAASFVPRSAIESAIATISARQRHTRSKLVLNGRLPTRRVPLVRGSQRRARDCHLSDLPIVAPPSAARNAPAPECKSQAPQPARAASSTAIRQVRGIAERSQRQIRPAKCHPIHLQHDSDKGDNDQ